MIVALPFLIALLSRPTLGGPDSLPKDTAVTGADLTVFLVTYDAGPLIWERFGHNAIWIRNQKTGQDEAYDYGRFDFGRTSKDRVRFIVNFVRGRMMYAMGWEPAQQMVERYRGLGRSIWVQELNLLPAERLDLYRFLERNTENPEYRYDYYLDNCSTRIRDAIDQAVGGRLKAWADTVGTRMSYRDHTRRSTENTPLLYSGLVLALGHPVDRPITAWEEMFLPVSLRPWLDRVVIVDSGGIPRKLASSDQHLAIEDRFPTKPVPTNWVPWYMAIGVAVGAVLILLASLGRRFGGARRGFYWTAAAWSWFAGILGIGMLGLWLLTDHAVARGNENVLQLSVLSIALAVALVRRKRNSRRLVMLSRWVVAISALGLALKALPWFYQSNWEIIAFSLPIHLAVMIGLQWLVPPPAAEPRVRSAPAVAGISSR